MKIEIITLNNGSKLIVVKIPESLSVTLMIITRCGPAFDPPNKSGISHFIEHLLFKGSTKYPNNEVLSNSLEKYGATSEGFSYHENNAYWIKIPKDNLDIAIDILTQQIQNSLFKKKDIDYEKKIIQEELSLIKSNPNLLIWELWSRTIFGNNSLGRIYTGEKEEIKNLTQKDILEFFKKNYTIENTIFVVSGNVEIKDVKQLFDKKINNYSRQLKPKTLLIEPQKKHIKIIYQNTDNLTVIYGFLTIDRFNKDSHILDLISYILGMGQGSCLYQNVANQGLTYSIYSSTKHLSSTGYLSINFTSKKDNLNLILKKIDQQINILKKGKITDSQLKRAKGYYIGQLIIQNDTTDNIASWIGYQAICDTNQILTIEDKQKIISEITKKDIIRVANKYFKTDKRFLSIIGPIKEKEIKLKL